MATAEAVQAPEEHAARPGAAQASSAPKPADPSDSRAEQRPYAPDQLVIVLLAGCALLILAMNLYDVISGIFGW